ncbi:hypothetical protein HWI79_3342 [Cryptosporidium felis]|nr:hypothetical protein HWI79_3342 [Cryptosporidium felis]
MENTQQNGDVSNLEKFIKLAYKQQLELVAEQEQQKLKLYGDYILSCIPHSIRKLKIKDIIEDQGKNVILSEEEKTEILDRLNEIANLRSLGSEPKDADGLYTNQLKKSRVKLLPISNSCYTIIREKLQDENDMEEEESLPDLSEVTDVMSSVQ